MTYRARKIVNSLIDDELFKYVGWRPDYGMKKVQAVLNVRRGVPAAVVIVKSHLSGHTETRRLLQYMGRLGPEKDHEEVSPLYVYDGTRLATQADHDLLLGAWSAYFEDHYKTDAHHLVFSFPPQRDARELQREADIVMPQVMKESLDEIFPENNWVFAVHNHPSKIERNAGYQGRIHAHVAVLACDFTGLGRIKFEKKQLHEMRHSFADAATRNGLELDASARFHKGLKSQKRVGIKSKHMLDKLIEQSKLLGMAVDSSKKVWRLVPKDKMTEQEFMDRKARVSNWWKGIHPTGWYDKKEGDGSDEDWDRFADEWQAKNEDLLSEEMSKYLTLADKVMERASIHEDDPEKQENAILLAGSLREHVKVVRRDISNREKIREAVGNSNPTQISNKIDLDKV